MIIEHTCIHVDNLQKELEFYTRALGLKVIWRAIGPSVTTWKGEIEMVYLGFKEEGPFIELIHEPHRAEGYKVGEKVDHICLTVNDMDEKLDELKNKGVNVLLNPVKPDYSDQIQRIAFIEDPEGVKIELKERK